MDFLVEKRKLDTAMKEIGAFLKVNGIENELRKELQDSVIKEKLLKCLPENKRGCSDFELNCYYIMFGKKIRMDEGLELSEGERQVSRRRSLRREMTGRRRYLFWSRRIESAGRSSRRGTDAVI